MPITILMPALSPTMTEGALVRWLISEGDVVKAGQILAEIETDKATMEVEAVDEGILGKILIPGGTENVKVNSPIALLLEEGETLGDLDSSFPIENQRQQSSPSSPSEPIVLSSESPVQKEGNSSSGERLFISPLARRIAGEKNLDLSTIKGSGPQGRIVKVDVEKAFSSPQNPPLPQAVFQEVGGYTDVPLNQMRKIIAKRLTESKQQIPHFYLTVDCELDTLLKMRQEINACLDGGKLSVNDFIIKACALSLMDVPESNVAWADSSLRHFHTADISVAVAIDGGLITPIVRSAHLKSLTSISAEVKKLAEKARSGQLTPEDYQGGSFTISNLGMYGVKEFSAILNPPQACILAVGAGQERAVVKNGHITAATLMSVTLSADHRAIDGAVAARFLDSFKKCIESPLKLML